MLPSFRMKLTLFLSDLVETVLYRYWVKVSDLEIQFNVLNFRENIIVGCHASQVFFLYVRMKLQIII